MNRHFAMLVAVCLHVGSEGGLAQADSEMPAGGSVFADGFEFTSQLSCDPLNLMSCNPDPSVSACYIVVASNDALCAASAANAGQNELCQFINGCNPGLSCLLPVPGMSVLACTHHCDPATGTTAFGTQCADLPQLGVGACVPINTIYTSSTISEVGMCIDCEDPDLEVYCN